MGEILGPLLGEGLVWERGSRPRAPCGEGAAGTSTPSLAASTGTKSSKKQLEILLIFQLLHKKNDSNPLLLFPPCCVVRSVAAVPNRCLEVV